MMGFSARGLVAALVLVLLPLASPAQDGGPARRRPELPALDPPLPPPPGRLLPPILPEDEADPASALAGRRVPIVRVVVRGATALAPDEIEAVTTRYTGRALGFPDVSQLRDELTALYVSRGFLSSGAVVPRQRLLHEGVLEIDVLEGQLSEIVVQNEGGRLRDRYVSSRIARATHPVNVAVLDERLQVLQRDPRIKRVRARLLPTEERGLARLELDVEEEVPLRVEIRASNDVSPTIGAERGRIALTHRNLSGWGDTLRLAGGMSEGLDELDASYDIPLTRFDSTLGLFVRGSRSELIDRAFERLEIESRSATYGIRFQQPLLQLPRSALALFGSGEVRRSKSFLLGSGTSFSPAVEDGVTKLAVVRAGLDYTLVRDRYVIALRSTLSFGLPTLDANESTGRLPSGDEIPDARFRSWLGQAQLAVRTGWLGAQAIVRADVQLSDSPLFGLEQFSVGGASSVRGYRENELVADQGFAASAELRIPVPLPSERITLEIAPFFDIGRAWNRDRRDPDIRTISSAGMGARVTFDDWMRLEVYWAHAFERDLPESLDEDDWQDEGLHVRMVVEY